MLTQGVTLETPPEFLVGCGCIPGQRCTLDGGCSCIAEQTVQAGGVVYDKHGRLRTKPGMPVYECNSACSCPADCSNRVVQRGISVRTSTLRCAHRASRGHCRPRAHSKPRARHAR